LLFAHGVTVLPAEAALTQAIAIPNCRPKQLFAHEMLVAQEFLLPLPHCEKNTKTCLDKCPGRLLKNRAGANKKT
jgi:hypothetical protein